MKADRIKFEIKRKKTDEELAAFEIVKILQDKGFETYIAGGAVRDEILEIPAHDIDIATSAKPEEVKKIFPRSYDRGKDFGVVVAKNKFTSSEVEREFEVATFRTDIGTSDHRRPEKVEFTTAEIDASRRDFTINGIFYDPVKEELIDFVGGLSDIKNKIVRFIGEPQERISEDYLRMLRAVRFATKFDFKLEEKSKISIEKNAQKIVDVSQERIREELSKMLINKNRVKSLELLSELKLSREILPELETLKNVAQPPEFHSEGDVWIHTMMALQNIGQTESEELVWTVLLHDIGKPQTQGFRTSPGKSKITFFDHDVASAKIAEEILHRLRFSHHFIGKSIWAISQHMRIVNAFRGMSERKIKKLFCDENIKLLLDLTKADLSACLRPDGKPDMTMYEDALKLREKFEKETSEEEKNQIKKFDLITGTEIMAVLKIPAGPKIGEVKSAIEKAYLDGKISQKDEALKMLEDYKE